MTIPGWVCDHISQVEEFISYWSEKGYTEFVVTTVELVDDSGLLYSVNVKEED
jgi:hypothetical protein